MTLDAFVVAHRKELIARCSAKAAARSGLSIPAEKHRDSGVPLFLAQLVEELDNGTQQTREIGSGAARHGRDLFFQGVSVAEVVRDYGDVCQSITDLAVELTVPVSADDFRTLNRCLDDAIAGAVAEYARQGQMVTEHAANSHSLALKNLVFTAITAFEILQGGHVAVGGTTGALLHRSLLAMRAYV